MTRSESRSHQNGKRTETHWRTAFPNLDAAARTPLSRSGCSYEQSGRDRICAPLTDRKTRNEQNRNSKMIRETDVRASLESNCKVQGSLQECAHCRSVVLNSTRKFSVILCSMCRTHRALAHISDRLKRNRVAQIRHVVYSHLRHQLCNGVIMRQDYNKTHTKNTETTEEGEEKW